MNKKQYKFGILASALATMALATSSCGDQFQEEYPWMIGTQENQSNEDEKGKGAEDITVLEQELRGAIQYMLAYSKGDSWQPHAYQYQRANNIDNYAGYWTVSKGTFTFGGALPTLYTYPNDYLGGPMDNTVFTQAYNAVFFAETLGKPEWRAVALIIQAYVGHETVDFYGACPFNDWRNKNRIPPLKYERGEDVYNQIFADLDEAIAILKQRQPSKDELSKIEDLTMKTVSDGDWTRWVKFANSIKLRMAMNIVKSHPDLAKEKAEAAVADGVLNIGDRDFAYNQTQAECCLYVLGNSWNDIRLCASLENILKRMGHPLLSEWFDVNAYPIKDKNSGVAAPIGVYGMRCGINMRNINVTGKDKGGYGPFATLSDKYKYMPQPFFKVTEALLLRAEGALRGWNMGGSAQQFYEDGIRLAFTDNGFTDSDAIEEYMNRTQARDIDYVDPYDEQHNIKGRVNVGVKWDESDSNELKLEKIITQKYIANFPMGAEAWTTFRRTGYPRLFPAFLNNGMEGVDLELQIRRIPLVETTNNALEIASLVEAIGGPNNGGTRVFWDIPTESRGEVFEENECQLVIPNNF